MIVNTNHNVALYLPYPLRCIVHQIPFPDLRLRLYVFRKIRRIFLYGTMHEVPR